MKNSFLFCMALLLLITGTALAQKPTVKFGASISDEKETRFRILGEDESNIYLMRFQRGRRGSVVPFFVKMERKTMKILNSTEMEFSIPGDGELHFYDIYYMKDRFVAMMTLTKRKNKKVAMLAYTIDKEGKMGTNNKILLEIRDPRDIEINTQYFKLLLTPDSTRFVALAYMDYKLDEFLAAAFDDQLNQIWNADINFKVGEEGKSLNFINTAVNNNTDLFVSAIMAIPRFGKDEDEYRIYTYDHKSNKVSAFPFYVPGKDKKMQVSNYGSKFVPDALGRMLYASTYHEKDASMQQEGVCVIDCYLDHINAELHPFSVKFRSAFMPDAKAEAGKQVAFYISVDDIIINPDKSFIVIYCAQKEGGYDMAMAIKFDEYLKEIWTTTVPVKVRMWTTPREYDTMFLMSTDEEIYFLYNDNSKNYGTIDPKETIMSGSLREGGPVVIIMNVKDGKLKKQPLFGAEVTGTYVMPSRCMQSGSKEILMLAKRGAEFNIGRVTLN